MSFYPASIPRCQHIKVNGTQCGSPAMHRRRFCFFHHQWRQERISIGAKRARNARAFDLPVLEDANAIQITLMQIMRLILRGQVDPKSAGLLLYALQTASVNLRNTQFEPRPQTRIVLDPRDVPGTPLDEDQWNPDDFEEEEEEAEDDDSAESGDEPEPEQSSGEQEGISASAEKETGAEKEIKAVTATPPAIANDQRRTTNDADPNRKKPSATATAAIPQSAAANDQRRSLACSEPSEGTNDRPPGKPRWYAPDGTPVTDSKLDQLRMLTQFLDYLAPLPPGEEE